MTDINVPMEELPPVSGPDDYGVVTCDGIQFTPATSLKLAKIWARRYLAIEVYLEAKEEAATQVSDVDRALAVNAQTLYGKALSKLTEKELEGVTKLYELQEKAGEVPVPEKSTEIVLSPVGATKA